MSRSGTPDIEHDALSKALLYVLISVDSEVDGVPEILFTETEGNKSALANFGGPPPPPGAHDPSELFVNRDAYARARGRLLDSSLCSQQGAALRAVDARLAPTDGDANIRALLECVLHWRFVSEVGWGVPGMRRLAPLAAPVEAMVSDERLTGITRASFCAALGCFLAEVAGKLPQAAYYLKEALEAKETELGADHEETGAALNELGACHRAMGQYDEAEALLLRAADVCARHGTTEARLAVEHNVATVYAARAQYSLAEERLKGALDTAGRALPADHPLVGCLLVAQAQLLVAMGQLETVDGLLTRALGVFNGSAATLAMQQAAASASASAELPSALTAGDKAARARGVRVAIATQQIGQLTLSLGRLVDGEKQLLSALAMLNEQCDAGHVRVLSAANALAVAFHNQGRHDEAHDILTRGLAACEAQRLGTHPLMAATLSNLAAVELDRGQPAQAEPLLRRAANVVTEVLGDAHPMSAAALHNLADACEANGRLDEALELYTRALELAESTLGAEHVASARTRSNLGVLLRKRGDADGARAHFARAHELLRARLGERHPETARALANVGCAAADAQRYDEAERALRAALAVEEEVLGPVHLETAGTLTNLGAVLAEQPGQADEAAATLRRAARAFRGTLGAGALQTRAALGWLKLVEARRAGGR